MIVEFKVNDVPPKKTKGRKSCWSGKDAKYVLTLRKHALEARKEAGMKDCFYGKVKMEIAIFAPNILQRKDSEDYIGDLDSLVAGIFESIQPGPTKSINPEVVIDPDLENNPDVGPEVPILVEDDAQVTQVIATKDESDSIHYTVKMESV